MRPYIITSFVYIFSFVACMQQEKEPDNIEKKAYLEQKNEVETRCIKTSTFQQQLVSNGELKALRKSELKFRISEEITAVKVKNGQKVSKDAVLVQLKDIGSQEKLQQAKTNLSKAKLDLQDVLIGMGLSWMVSQKQAKKMTSKICS